jgi:Flp pilus assembly protein TadD
MIHEGRGRRDEAIAEYEKVLAGDPHAGVAANNLAWIRIEQGRLDEAVSLAGVASGAMKTRPEPHDTLGWAYLKQGQAGRAISSFERALTLAPRNPVYHYHLGLAYAEVGDKRRARTSLSRALELKLDPHSASDARKVIAELDVDGQP